MGLILRIIPNRKFRLRNNANGQEAVFEVRRAINRPGEFVLALYDDARLYDVKLMPRPEPAAGPTA